MFTANNSLTLPEPIKTVMQPNVFLSKNTGLFISHHHPELNTSSLSIRTESPPPNTSKDNPFLGAQKKAYEKITPEILDKFRKELIEHPPTHFKKFSKTFANQYGISPRLNRYIKKNGKLTPSGESILEEKKPTHDITRNILKKCKAEINEKQKTENTGFTQKDFKKFADENDINYETLLSRIRCDGSPTKRYEAKKKAILAKNRTQSTQFSQKGKLAAAKKIKVKFLTLRQMDESLKKNGQNLKPVPEENITDNVRNDMILLPNPTVTTDSEITQPLLDQEEFFSIFKKSFNIKPKKITRTDFSETAEKKFREKDEKLRVTIPELVSNSTLLEERKSIDLMQNPIKSTSLSEIKTIMLEAVAQERREGN